MRSCCCGGGLMAFRSGPRSPCPLHARCPRWDGPAVLPEARASAPRGGLRAAVAGLGASARPARLRAALSRQLRRGGRQFDPDVFGQEPILARSGESSSSSLLHGQVDRLRSVCSAVSAMLASRSSGCPRQRGQLSCSGQTLRTGRPWGAHGGLAPDRKARSARHNSRTSSSLTRDIDRPHHRLTMQGPSAAFAAVWASPFARQQVWQPGWPWSTSGPDGADSADLPQGLHHAGRRRPDPSGSASIPAGSAAALGGWPPSAVLDVLAPIDRWPGPRQPLAFDAHSAAHSRTMGQVRVRVIPSTVCILAMTTSPRSSTLAASVSAMTS